MPDYPLVSIGAINYNNANYVIETLNSIRDQAYPAIELIIVDDCSTDNSAEIIMEWLKTAGIRSEFIRHEINKGICAGCNAALNAATGKYFSLIATDDMMLPEKIARQVQILESTSETVACLYSDAYVVDEHGAPLDGLFIEKHRQFSKMPSGSIYDILLAGNFIPGMTALFKTHILKELGGYDEALVYEDYDMWLRIARKYEILFSDFISCKYRVRPGSLSQTIKNWGHSDASIFLKHADALLPVDRLCDIAWLAYLSDDRQTLEVIKQIGVQTKDRLLMTTWLLWEFGIDMDCGKQIITGVRRNIANGLSNLLVNPGDEDVNIFLNEIAHSISPEVLEKLVYEGYRADNRIVLLLLDDLAKKARTTFLITTCLLWRLGISFSVGVPLLNKVNERKESEVSAKTHAGKDANTAILLNDIVPELPEDFLKRLVIELYNEQNEHNKEIVPLVKELALKTNDRYFKTVYLLWKFRVSPAIGAKILVQIKEGVKESAAGSVNNFIGPDAHLFVREILSLISIELIRDVAIDAYVSDNNEMMLMLSELADRNNDRIIATACLLWKLSIAPSAGHKALMKLKGLISNELSQVIAKKYGSDIEMFLGEVSHLIEFEEFKKIASAAYYNNNLLLIPIIKEIARKTKSRYFKAALSLWKYKVNAHTGEVILNRIDGYCNKKLSNLYIDMCIYKDIYHAIKTSNSTYFK